ncbi:glycerophosphodiester phosphodiesterase [Schleiferilactobacillus shenzhenensis]|uniref:GP-PDE domain-containing protein n=1 Tax=Schleiferilactobacillus shenzhenensis LY-73 TaxID=1231336 RepID=U4TKF4_9LACO|nr:glycerophosphodiester phosphodiesterase [Schleiferilactobacillus shenzhenensis]ERL64694.1 hypothetical protein L248_0751 [Schleiferilactobacillus shenzhenensis LY-73]
MRRHSLYLVIMLVTLISVFTSGFTVIGHRGEYFSNQDGTVEHTYQAYDNALRDGADYLEIDLERTADGTLVVSHDPTTNRLTGVSSIISQIPWTTLQGLPLRNTTEHFHSLEEVFQRYQADPRAKFLIETRKTPDRLEQETALVALINAYGLQNRVYFQSFSSASLRRLMQLMPGVKTMLLTNSSQHITPQWLQQYADITSLGFYWPAVTGQAVNVLHQAKKQIYPWFDADEPSSNTTGENVIGVGADGVITNWTQQYRSLPTQQPTPAGSRFRVHNATFLYAGAGSHATATRKLGMNSTWQVHATITIAGTPWYEAAPNQWIPATAGLFLNSEQVNQVHSHHSIIQVTQKPAVIHSSPTADSPRQNRKLAVGTRWQSGLYLFDGTSVWYNVGRNQWIRQ